MRNKIMVFLKGFWLCLGVSVVSYAVALIYLIATCPPGESAIKIPLISLLGYISIFALILAIYKNMGAKEDTGCYFCTHKANLISTKDVCLIINYDKNLALVVTDDDGSVKHTAIIGINHCPICGRSLK